MIKQTDGHLQRQTERDRQRRQTEPDSDRQTFKQRDLDIIRHMNNTCKHRQTNR